MSYIVILMSFQTIYSINYDYSTDARKNEIYLLNILPGIPTGIELLIKSGHV